MPPAGKQPKRSRKKQLADLAAHKKQLREEAADNPHTPPPALPAEDAADERMEGIAFEEAGERSARHAGAYSKRRSRERLRGVSQAAGSMAEWLVADESIDTDAVAVASLAAECAASAISRGLALAEEQRQELLREAKAAAEKARYAEKQAAKSVSPTQRVIVPRLSRSLESSQQTKRKRGSGPSATDPQRKLKPRRVRDTVPISLSQDKSDLPAHLADREDLPVAPLYLQRRWARISRQYMAEYRKGADGCAAIQAVKALRSKRHRDTSDPRSRQVEAEMAALSGNM